MRRLILRLLGAVVTLWLLVTLCFLLLHAAPGGPFDTEKSVPAEIAAHLAARYHMDQPVWHQYFDYLAQLAHGDLGPSFQYPDFNVNELIAQALPISCVTGGLALLLALLIGVPLGTVAALDKQHLGDRLLMTTASISQALPKFVIAPLLILLFAVKLRWLPAGGWVNGDWRYVLLPVIALALPNLAYCARLMRASLIDVLQSDHLRAARARGFGKTRLLLVHAFKPALLPLIGWLSPALIAVVTGSAVVEQVFGIPGVGRYFVQGALNRDYTLVLGVVLVAGTLVIGVNLLVDGLRIWLDPRQRE